MEKMHSKRYENTNSSLIYIKSLTISQIQLHLYIIFALQPNKRFNLVEN